MFDEFTLQIDNFMLFCDSKNLSIKTKGSYEQALRLFSQYMKNNFEVTDAVDVKTAHVRKYIQHLRERGKYTVVVDFNTALINKPQNRNDRNKPISDTTIAIYLRNIKVFYNFLVDEREVKESPLARIKTIKPVRKQKKLLSPSEIKLLLSAFDITTFHGYRGWVMTRLILDCWIRVGEGVNLKPEDIDIRGKALLIRNTKNKKERYAYVSDRLMKDLKRWLLYRDRFCDSDWLFPTNRGNKQDVRLFEKQLKKTASQVSLEVAPHQLRNNFAKYYLLNGGDFVTLSRILGHSSVEVTQTAYLDFTDNEVAKKYQMHSPFNNFKF